MAFVGESVFLLRNKRKGDGQREMQEEADNSKKKKVAASTSKLGRKIIVSYIEVIMGMNTLDVILAE